MMVDTLTAKSDLPPTRNDGPYRNPYNIPREPVMSLDSQPLAPPNYATNPTQQSYNQSNYFLHQQNPIYPPVSHHGPYYNNQGYNGYYGHNNFHNNGQNKNSELTKFGGDRSGQAQSSRALGGGGQSQRQESSPDSLVSASSPESAMSPLATQFQPQDQSDSRASQSVKQEEPRGTIVHDQQPLFPGPEAPVECECECDPVEHLSPQPGDTPPVDNKQDVRGSGGESDRHQEQQSPVAVKEELKDDTPPPSLIPPPGSFDNDNRQSDINVSEKDEEKREQDFKVEPQQEKAQDDPSDPGVEKDPNAPLDPNASEGDAQQEQGETNISKLEAAVRENLEQAIKQHNVQRSTNHGPPFLTSPPLRPDSHDSNSSPMKDPVLKDLPRPEELFPGHRPSLGTPGSPRGGGLFPPPHMPFHNIFQRAISEPGFRPGGPGDLFNQIRTPTSASPPPSSNLSIPPSFPRPPPSQPLPQFMNHSQRDIPPSPHKPTDFSKAKTPEGSAMSPMDSKELADSDNAGEYFYCHLCSYVGTSKSSFNEHMDSHFEHRCPECDYTSRTEGRLKRHIKDFHCDDDNLRREPGRPKTFRCRQCDFVAKEKEEYWSHARTHIKDDKVLQCPKCPFVTEYKHHLEYHLRNHFGSKPFKCTKCNYSCVNKSMLNSHMKSHTNVYQYRCADCTYATKYCHSLKLHLQKYNHTPALVLNPDGSLPTDGSGDFELVSKRGPPRGPRGPRKLGEKELPPGHPMMHMDPGMMFAQAGLNGHGPLNMIAAATGGFWPGMMPSGLQPPPPLIPVSQMNPLHIQMPGQDIAKSNTPQPHMEVERKKCKMCDFAVESRHALAEHMMKVHAAEHRDILQILGMPVENPMAAMAAAAAAKVAEQQHALMKVHGLTTPTKDPIDMAKAWGMMQKGMHASPPTPRTPSTPGSQASPRYPEEYTPHGTPNKTDYRNQMAMEIAKKLHSQSNGKNLDGALDLTNKSEQNGSSALDFSPGAKRRLYEEDVYVGSSGGNVISGSDSNPNTPMGAVNGNASPPRKRSRKGKAYKLDVLSMKLQEKYSTSPAPGMDYEDSIDEDAEYPSDYPSSERGDSNDCNTNGFQENCDGRATPDYKALQESIRALNSGEPRQHYELSPKEGDDHPADDSATEKMDGATMFSSSINRKKIMVERHMESEKQLENCPVENNADSTNDLPKPNDADKYECQHCDISFKDCIMYTMHMGYHGYQHPFKCNMCGQLCENKVDFFLHIARTAHE